MADTGATIANAYVQIIPSTKGIGKGIQDAFDEEGEKSGKSFGSKFLSASGKIIGGTAKVVAAGTAATGAAISLMTKSAIQSYADYEQLVGGVETLFEDMSSDVIENSKKAYQTAGLSANEYLETVMGFSASLNQSLMANEGDIARAADLSNQIIIDMSDNANKMGSDMESIQNAYAGFSKQNYTMLDNLKLGYGGTKEEMQRLLDDANELNRQQGIFTDYQIDNFADISEAIHVVQTDMGITGTTYKEAAGTISGSITMMKKSWSDLVTGIANPDADLGALMDNFVESVGIAANNVVPVIARTIPKIIKGFKELVAKLVPLIPEIIAPILPAALQPLLPVVMDVVTQLIDAFSQLAPVFMELGQQLLPILADAIREILPLFVQIIQKVLPIIADLISKILPIVLQIVQKVLPPLLKLLEPIIDVALQLIDALMPILDIVIKLLDPLVDIINVAIMPIIEALTMLVEEILGKVRPVIDWLVEHIGGVLVSALEKVNPIIRKVGDVFKDVMDKIKSVWSGIVEFFEGLWNGIKNAWSGVAKFFGDIVTKVREKIDGMVQAGKDIISGLLKGLKAMWGEVETWIKQKTEWIANAFGLAGHTLADKLNPNTLVSKAQSGAMNKVTVKAAVISGKNGMPSNIKVPKMASGGIVEHATLAEIGEAGAEAVIPLENNSGFLRALANDISEASNSKSDTSILEDIRAELANLRNLTVVMDTGATVGALASPMDNALGKIASRRERFA